MSARPGKASRRLCARVTNRPTKTSGKRLTKSGGPRPKRHYHQYATCVQPRAGKQAGIQKTTDTANSTEGDHNIPLWWNLAGTRATPGHGSGSRAVGLALRRLSTSSRVSSVRLTFHFKARENPKTYRVASSAVTLVVLRNRSISSTVPGNGSALSD